MTVAFGPCCFCGEGFDGTNDHDPCNVTVTTAKGKWQTWFCHADCFRERLAKPDGYPDGFLDPAHF